jgi:hypothetical protein
MNKPHTIIEKMDGSMIRPIVVNGVVRLATKMGVTDVSLQAEAMVAAWPETKRDLFAEYMKAVYHGMTPLLEFVSPENRIVLKYDTPDLVLLGVRRMMANIPPLTQNFTVNGLLMGSVLLMSMVNCLAHWMITSPNTVLMKVVKALLCALLMGRCTKARTNGMFVSIVSRIKFAQIVMCWHCCWQMIWMTFTHTWMKKITNV